MRHMDRRTDRRIDDVGNGNGNGNGSPTYLLPLTSYPRKRRKVRGQYSGRSCGGQRIQSTEPADRLTPFLHVEERQRRAAQMMQMMNVSTEINPPIHPLSRAKATTKAGEREREREQMMNVSTLTNQPIHRLASLPRKSYHSGW